MSDHDRTILKAAASILRDDALDRARQATTDDERRAVNEALLGHICIERYLAALDDLDRPF